MITVFTPTYNRGNLLNRLYQSLCKQIYKEFEWVIVDDGSRDNTASIVELIQKKHLRNEFSIRYFNKENGGKHTAINLGVKKAQGELFFIADSDDFLPADSLLIVHEEWDKIKHDDSFLGLSGVDADAKGNIIGSGLPKEYIDCHAWEISTVYKVTGDLKEVFRTEVLRQFPFPEIKGERFCPEVLVWFRMARHYKMRFLNRIIYIADYQPNGITSAISRLRMNSPIGSMLTYSELVHYPIPFKDKLRNSINYWRFRFCLTTKNKAGVSPNEVDIPKISGRWYFLAPIGYLMHLKDKRNI
ncbi:glycosyltransferase family 2 protein [Prevotella scopos JCM 17725]|uniref:Glycosyl transferase family 2 n=1 Tax=Prevotella scopos JCM 17725 TaxID=1236518 RepID=A0AAX2F2T9_9BACT|nr:glycosyltransferase family A protein [Prevotella scopos]ANR72772.1 glycosyl transferase [Prevotella scopos JCM 17725]QUB45011.1 glycosyltransferase family 2 protein [Prevotella scopos JCM 17725]SHF70624.1 Glycosyl transferase family 2 [Prevotella scopos JCM 17725]